MPDNFAANLNLKLIFCDSPEDAVKHGHVYTKESHTPLKIEEVVVVRRGTVKGNNTVDMILVDEKGNKYVTLVTANLLKMIPVT